MRSIPALTLIALAFLPACLEYGLEKDVLPAAPGENLPDLVVEPAFHDFGTLELGQTANVTVTLANVGNEALHVEDLVYDAVGTELSLDVDPLTNGPLPWTIEPGEAIDVHVSYVPVDESVDDGAIVVASDDPEEPTARAEQTGRTRPFPGFSTGWYIYEDPTVYETLDPAHVVDRVGDPDGYWYEPSGVHGLVDSLDPEADFADLRSWILAHAGAPVPVTGPLTFVSDSAIPDLEGASYTWILCDFWIDWTDDPTTWSVTTGLVDDGVRVIVNGEVLGDLEYGQTGSWPLRNAVPGTVNSLVVILQDNAAVERFVTDLGFWHDGMMVEG